MPPRETSSVLLAGADGSLTFSIASRVRTRNVFAFPMQSLIPSDKIKLRLKKSALGDLADGGETTITLSEKLKELFAAGHVRDDIYGLVIPLLMQGKVRIDIDDRSERLEMEDQTQRLQRSNAVQVFEDFLLFYRPEKTAEGRVASPAV